MEEPDKAAAVKLAECAYQSIAAGGVTLFEASQAVAITIMLNVLREGGTEDQAVQAASAHSNLDVVEVEALATALYRLGADDSSWKTTQELASGLLEPLRQGGFELP